MAQHTFLLELLVEDMPSRVQLPAENQMVTLLDAFLSQNGMAHATLKSFSTPRRLAVLVTDLPAQTAGKTEEKRGPRVEAGFDEAGNPSRALEGFLRSCGEGVNASDLEQRDTGKGVFFFYNVAEKGQPTQTLLAGFIPTLIEKLNWPKSMRWGDVEKPFIRPLMGITALWDDAVIPCAWNGITSGRETQGHLFLSKGALSIPTASAYPDLLKEAHVILEREARIALIRHQIESLAKGKAVIRESLLEEVAGLVEKPFAVMGSFDAHYLSLPPELLEITMAEHQRYFPVSEDGGKTLSASFVGISNVPDSQGLVARGYGKVLAARFSDAAFYWQQDVEKPLLENLPRLQRVVFHQALGTLHDKVARMQGLVDVLVPYMKGLPVAQAYQAVKLSKCDLVCGTVFEFPELQGVIGAEILQRQGAEPALVQAVAAQYRYDDFEGLSPVAQAVILADRLDTIVGFFGADMKPSGSGDPYALRRAALSVIRLLRTFHIRLPLLEAFKAAYALHGRLKLKEDDTLEALRTFFLQRLQVMLREEGVSADRVDAVFALGLDDVVDVSHRASALEAFLRGDDGAALYGAFKRAANILEKMAAAEKARDENGVESHLLQDEAEKRLFTSVTAIGSHLNHAISREDYADAMGALTQLRVPVDHFFEAVHVMADDEQVKQNRLALLSSMTGLFGRIADFGRLVG